MVYRVSSLADERKALGEQVQLEFVALVIFPLNSPFYWTYQCIGKNGLGASPQPELLKRRVGATAVIPTSIMMLLPSSVQSPRQRERELPGSLLWP